MIPGRIEGSNLKLTSPTSWDKDQDGPCSSLFVRRDSNSFTSAWYPNTDEIARLLAGAPIHLTIVGSSHPPVAIHVGDPPK